MLSRLGRGHGAWRRELRGVAGLSSCRRYGISHRHSSGRAESEGARVAIGVGGHAPLSNELLALVARRVGEEAHQKLRGGVLLRRPFMVVVAPTVSAEVNTGKFWRLLGPVSASPGSLAVRPLAPKSGVGEDRVPEDALARDARTRDFHSVLAIEGNGVPRRAIAPYGVVCSFKRYQYAARGVAQVTGPADVEVDGVRIGSGVGLFDGRPQGALRLGVLWEGRRVTNTNGGPIPPSPLELTMKVVSAQAGLATATTVSKRTARLLISLRLSWGGERNTTPRSASCVR